MKHWITIGIWGAASALALSGATRASGQAADSGAEDAGALVDSGADDAGVLADGGVHDAGAVTDGGAKEAELPRTAEPRTRAARKRKRSLLCPSTT